MGRARSVVINGDLGSGKTSVSTLLAQQLGIRRVSVGALYRAMAAQRGMTALQLNLHAELDDKIDHYVDQLQADIAASGERLVVDSRLAWHFFTDALKVHLIVAPDVAARRVFGREATAVESYATVEEARRRIDDRSTSERHRFLARYGIDKRRLRNYDLICDTSRATPAATVDRIVGELDQPPPDGAGPACFLDPTRIFPTRSGAGQTSIPADTAMSPITVGYAYPWFFVVSGHRRLGAAIHSGQPLIAARLVAEADEKVGHEPCEDYFRARVTAELVEGWERTYGLRLPDGIAPSRAE